MAETPDPVETARRDAIQGAIDTLSSYFLDHCPKGQNWEDFDSDADTLRTTLQKSLEPPVPTGFDQWIEKRKNTAPDVARRLTIEKRMASALVKRLLQDGYSVSVFDGEDWPVRHSTDEKVVMMALSSTDEDTIAFHDADKKKLGWFYLVYGNSGWDVVSDYSANPISEEIWNTTISPLADKFEASV